VDTGVSQTSEASASQSTSTVAAAPQQLTNTQSSPREEAVGSVPVQKLCPCVETMYALLSLERSQAQFAQEREVPHSVSLSFRPIQLAAAELIPSTTPLSTSERILAKVPPGVRLAQSLLAAICVRDTGKKAKQKEDPVGRVQAPERVGQVKLVVASPTTPAEYWPPGRGVHCSRDVAPRSLLYVPEGQGIGAPEEGGQKKPAGQIFLGVSQISFLPSAQPRSFIKPLPQSSMQGSPPEESG